MRTFLSSLAGAVIGGILVFVLMSGLAPSTQPVKEIVRTQVTNGGSAATVPGSLTPQQIYERYSAAVVQVRATATANYNNFWGLPMRENEIASGSGFIVSNDGYVVTNAHVVQGADNIKVQLLDNAEVPAKLVGVDESTDLAFLKVDLSGHKHQVLALGDSRSVKVGEPVYAIGNPLEQPRSMSGGIVSALNRDIIAPNDSKILGVIQTDAAINRGNSGGPLISAQGKVIGVTAQIATEGSGNIGIAFAIPSATVRKVFAEIKESGKASHPWIGIIGATLFPELAKELKLKVKAGAFVVEVLNPGPAKKAGLKGADRTLQLGSSNYDVGGDVIVKVNKTDIVTMEDVIREVNQYRVGREIELTLVDGNNKTRKVKVTLEERPEDLPSRR